MDDWLEQWLEDNEVDVELDEDVVAPDPPWWTNIYPVSSS